jgi:hypothetical protein
MRPLGPLSTLLALTLFPGCIIHIDGGDWDGHAYQGDWSRPKLSGNGVAASETRSLDAFDALQNDTLIDVSVKVGAEQSVVLRGDENLLGCVETVVRGGSLVVRMKPGQRYELDEPLRLDVCVPSLRAYAAHGHGDARMVGLHGDAFALSVTGHGDARLEGEVEQLTISVNGHGDVDASELVARRASITITGHGDVYAHVIEHLQASVTGSGDVRYRGNPSASVSISGDGSIAPVPHR